MTRIFRQRLLATTLFVGAGLVASPAFAQDASPAKPADNAGVPVAPETTAPVEGTSVPSTNADGERVEDQGDIVVTGSRIPQPNLTSSSPVTVVTAQEVKLQGTSRVEDLVNSLPQSFAAQGSNVSNGSTGTATVNLRGLGSSRTLVLVNGRRLMPGDPRSPVADINFIPAPLIKRVDVLTGGASSVYGADAVAGVVNFIMDTTFTGVRIEGQASVFSHKNRASSNITGAIDARGFPYPSSMTTDGGAQDISVAMGAGFDDNRGHVTGYATYRTQDAVTQDRRDYSTCALSGLTAAQTATTGRQFSCGGSGTSANGTFFTTSGTYQVGPNRTFIPGSTPFNFAPYNYFQRPNERYTFGVFADYEISKGAKPYLEAMFMNDQSVAQIAPSGNFGNTGTINCDNPLLSAQQRTLICNADNLTGNLTPNGAPIANLTILRRNVEGGGRQDDLEHTAYRIVGGMRGDLIRGVSYDASYQYGKTILAETYLNDFSVSRLTRALDVVTGANGQPVCRSVLDGSDANCVPYDIFGTGTVSAASLNYLQTPGFQRGNTQERIANVNFTVQGAEYGLTAPWTDRGVGLNVGAEYRKESLQLLTDTAFTTGDLAGQGGPTIGVEGSFDVKELFGEVQIPIVSNNFFYDVNVSAGYRYSDYRVAGNSFNTDTYKLTAEIAPIRDIRLRGSYNRAVRAPNIVELFSAQSVGLSGLTDPCAGAAPEATAAQCALTGVTAAQYGRIRENPSSQYNGFLGGNPNLEPETADSYTVGVILQPSFVPGLAITVDGFDIRVKNLIGTIGVDQILQQCISTGDPFFCSRIVRDPSTGPNSGSLYLTPNGYTIDTNTNVGGLRTRGIDVNASYARRIGGLGSLNASFVGTYLDKLETQSIGEVRYDCTGFFGASCGTPNPEWRHKLRLGFTFPNGLGVSGQWRYFSKAVNDRFSNDTDLRQPITTANPDRPGNNLLPAQSFFDLAFQARVGQGFNFRIGANNVFDKSPPVAGSQVVGPPFGNGNTYPQVYDSLGRYLFAGATIEF